VQVFYREGKMPYKSGSCCGSPDHRLDRRGFLGRTAAVGGAALAADMGILSVLKDPVLAEEIKRQEKRVVLLWLAGGASQLETWDPKPGAPYRRTVSRDRHQRTGDPDLGTDAQAGAAPAAHGDHPLTEYEER